VSHQVSDLISGEIVAKPIGTFFLLSNLQAGLTNVGSGVLQALRDTHAGMYPVYDHASVMMEHHLVSKLVNHLIVNNRNMVTDVLVRDNNSM
jgi:hypothetical protein